MKGVISALIRNLFFSFRILHLGFLCGFTDGKKVLSLCKHTALWMCHDTHGSCGQNDHLQYENQQ